MDKTQIIEVMESFEFSNGARLAWVTYLIGTSIERRCIGVREVLSYGPSRAGGKVWYPTPKTTAFPKTGPK